MLALKAVLAESRALPTIFFDEIDTGVSGATAGSIADLLRDLSKKIQIIAITHLPQMASAGNQQLFVFKDTASATVQTQLKELVGDERIHEIARLLSSSSDISETARNNAREMLGRFL
jgi:DNA repair protein RecN (Recombination protein N)